MPSSCGACSPLGGGGGGGGGGEARTEADGDTPEGSGSGAAAAPKRASFTPEQLRKLQVQMHVHSQLLVQVLLLSREALRKEAAFFRLSLQARHLVITPRGRRSD